MRRSRLVLSTLTSCSLVVVAGLAYGTSAAEASGPSVTVVASHLNNPRGLSAVGGQLYLAEAGRGGTNCVAGNCAGLTITIKTRIERLRTLQKQAKQEWEGPAPTLFGERPAAAAFARNAPNPGSFGSCRYAQSIR